MSKGMQEYHCPLCGASLQTMPFPGGEGAICSCTPEEPPYFSKQLRTLFPGQEAWYVDRLVRLALDEDGPDLTALGIFSPTHEAQARIYAKEPSLIIGLPLISLVLYHTGLQQPEDYWKAHLEEGSKVREGQTVAQLHGPAVILLKAERVILNLITHLSGVANLTHQYVQELEGSGVRLLDTRKTLPGQRYLEKYAVRMAGGWNHRKNLAEMLMIKDNHIDAAGSITQAVNALRECYGTSCPPIEVECRTKAEVLEAVNCSPNRILLDNMDIPLLQETLPLVPASIEAEISGGVNLKNIRSLAFACPARPADFISVGRITHSAPVADFSMAMST